MLLNYSCMMIMIVKGGSTSLPDSSIHPFEVLSGSSILMDSHAVGDWLTCNSESKSAQSNFEDRVGGSDGCVSINTIPSVSCLGICTMQLPDLPQDDAMQICRLQETRQLHCDAAWQHSGDCSYSCLCPQEHVCDSHNCYPIDQCNT